MSKPAPRSPGPHGKSGRWLPTWFKLSIVVIAALILLKVLQLRIFVEVSFDGVPYLASLTDMKTYFILLGLLLVYILGSWAWNRFFDSGNR